jgi:hypothetical protein
MDSRREAGLRGSLFQFGQAAGFGCRFVNGLAKINPGILWAVGIDSALRLGFAISGRF